MTGTPFIHRKLRPEVGGGQLAPPLLAISALPSEVGELARQVLHEGTVERLGLVPSDESAWIPSRTFVPHPEVISAELDNETVLLDLRTAASYTLNREGTVLWNLLSAGRTLRAAQNALCRQFAAPGQVAWADLTTLVRDLCNEGLLLERRGKRSRNATAPVNAGPAADPSPGCFALQAIALEKAGIGILIAAPDDWETSPPCVALQRAGYRLLSKVAPASRRTSPNAPRRSHVAAPAPEPFQPRVLIFPQTVDWPESSLEPMRRARALEELLWLTFVMKGQTLPPPEFHTLARLVEMTDCYRLHCGEKNSDLAAVLDRLLEHP